MPLVFGLLMAGTGSWVFNKVSTCSKHRNRGQPSFSHLLSCLRKRVRPQAVMARGAALTQSLFEGLDISSLGTALSPLFVIGARVTQSRACATAWTNSIALELALPANHACQPLRLGNTGVVGDWFSHMNSALDVGTLALVATMAIAGRAVVV